MDNAFRLTGGASSDSWLFFLRICVRLLISVDLLGLLAFSAMQCVCLLCECLSGFYLCCRDIPAAWTPTWRTMTISQKTLSKRGSGLLERNAMDVHITDGDARSVLRAATRSSIADIVTTMLRYGVFEVCFLCHR
jgi:hypothetical protein